MSVTVSPVSIPFVPVSFPAPVPPFLICFMLVVPVIPVPIFPAVADKFLAFPLSPKIFISISMFIKVQISLWLIQYNLMGMVQIIPPVPRW